MTLVLWIKILVVNGKSECWFKRESKSVCYKCLLQVERVCYIDTSVCYKCSLQVLDILQDINMWQQRHTSTTSLWPWQTKLSMLPLQDINMWQPMTHNTCDNHSMLQLRDIRSSQCSHSILPLQDIRSRIKYMWELKRRDIRASVCS